MGYLSRCCCIVLLSLFGVKQPVGLGIYTANHTLWKFSNHCDFLNTKSIGRLTWIHCITDDGDKIENAVKFSSTNQMCARPETCSFWNISKMDHFSPEKKRYSETLGEKYISVTY